ncbi:porphyromonas-type peptidyl-arginine deiminase superfamily [Penicillium angulare]|uniref:Porphyromonas-type peptidyl-arginine deiminase superfamily n=1 Tax=Penicillium angulare TaxID=116970 RepID=A0A9W9K5X8_9EURO|nr:porphyromonas-type peptidyl-arginine deiminase superfamily [Penicillium angulare]
MLGQTESIPGGSAKYPAEWASHIATILGFPSECSLPSNLYEAACSEIIELAGAISHFEAVRLYTRPTDVPRAQSMLSSTGCGSHAIDIIPFATNHLWVRDTGPVYVHGIKCSREKYRAAISFGFNEWGGNGGGGADGWPELTAEHIQENQSFAKRVIQSEHDIGLTEINAEICLEGGALVSDGDGTLIVSESSIISKGRNPGMTKKEIENQLTRLLGVEKIIWFPGFHNLDVTDVHADAEIQFVRPGVLVVSKPHESARKEWHDVYSQVTKVLETETDARGRRFEFHVIDEPDPQLILPSDNGEQEDDPATNYVNFYYVNGGLILPMFGDESADKAALRTMQHLHPDRVVRQVYVNALPLTGGVIHCATQPVL